MLSAAKVPLFFWAEAIATACFTQNRSLVIPRHEKTLYHIINDRKPSVNFFYIFGSICYIVRDGENLDKMKEKEVIPTTSVSRPSLKSNPQGDRVMHNNSQEKKHEVEDHRRSVKLSNNKTSITAFAKPLKETVASKSIKKPRNFTRKLYERVGVPMCQILHCLLILLQLVEIVLFIVDSRCSKHMTGNLKLLINFVEKFLGTVKFRNDQIAPIHGYGDLVQGAVTIKRVYYVEGLVRAS
nr:retrovirus-related Pol polyprotein from transposon TNT 1-94 [Tanacetum cinerariifolium]